MTAPPAPDPTAYKDGQGFTGFESLLNYVYWQTLALNPYDQLGHLLRVVLFVNSCSAFQTGPVTDSNKDLFSQCNSWLGPYQPGVTAPDPTDNVYPADNSSPVAARKSKQPKPGSPEATKPLPGQDNPSVPKVVLPPAIQQLLNQLPNLPVNTPTLNDVKANVPGLTPPAGGPSDNKSSDKLLDFLLSP